MTDPVTGDHSADSDLGPGGRCCVDCGTLLPTGDRPQGRRLIVDRQVLIDTLVAHQRHTIKGCLCGWSDLGKSHPEHIVRVLEQITETRRG